jgi:uncharacterized protein (TIGR03503 family)
MKINDPHNLRKPALRMLGGLLPEKSRFGAALFGTRTEWIVRPAEKTAGTERLERASTRIHSRDMLTDMEGALRFAIRDWNPGKTAKSILILLTDGRVDVDGDESADRASRQRILQEVLPTLKAKGIRVYTIALSPSADASLLQRLSNSTGAWYAEAGTAADLQRAFLKIFEQFSSAPQVPLEDNAFRIDRSVSEFTALIFKRNNGSVTLISPKGERFELESARKGMRWFSDVGFELITVEKPQAGVWKVLGPVDPGNRVMVLSDLKLDVNNDELPANLLAGDEVTLKVALKEKAYIIKRPSFLKLVQFTGTVTTEPGETFELLLTDDGTDGDDKAHDGIFSYLIQAPRRDAEISLKVQVKSPTFERIYRRSMRVYATFYDADLLPSESPEQSHRIVVLPREAVVDGTSLAVEGELISAADETTAKLDFHSEEDGTLVADIPPTFPQGPARLALRASGQTLFGRAIRDVRLEKDVDVPPPVAPPETPQEPAASESAEPTAEAPNHPEQETPAEPVASTEDAQEATAAAADAPAEETEEPPADEGQPESAVAGATDEPAADAADEGPADESSGLSMWWWILGGVLFNALVLGGGYVFWRRWQKKQAEEQAALAASLDEPEPETDAKQE